RLRLDGRRAEGDRPHRELLDRHLAARQLQGPRDPLHHPRRGGARGGSRDVLPHPRVRRDDDQLRLQALPRHHGRGIRFRLLEHLPVPFLRRRQLERRRHADLRLAAQGRDPAQGEPVRVRAGGEPLRQRPIHQGSARGLRRGRERRAFRDRQQGRHLQLHQGLPREGLLVNENKDTRLPPHLSDIQREIEGYARGFGLDLYETIFEVLGYDEINMVAAYGGFPNRYPHWRFGMEYEQLSKGYEYGLSKIYEMVINNNPSYAYLLESNMDVDQKLVMAHVFGHVDFFKNNFSFRHTNRKMMDEMANHATRVRRIIDKVGLEPVETFIDRSLSLENLIDQHSPHIKRRGEKNDDEDKPIEVRGFKADREYMQGFINPREFLDEQRKKLEEERAAKKKFPERPQRDVLLFILENAPLERWEGEILSLM